MTKKELNTALYKKLYAEHQEFVKELQGSAPEFVIELAYELVIREDILMSLEENDLEPQQCKALLKEKKPLEQLFNAWEHYESSHIREMFSCVEDKADKLAFLMKTKHNRESR